MKFNRVEDLKQLKTKEELIDKCEDIIKSLENYTKHEKYRILKTLYESFVENCKENGIMFLEMGLK